MKVYAIRDKATQRFCGTDTGRGCKRSNYLTPHVERAWTTVDSGDAELEANSILGPVEVVEVILTIGSVVYETN